jgi:demethylmenaquinone methyltransferase/2-methoxy-6-polyprenyl-1,4-benzoquinol methylase
MMEYFWDTIEACVPPDTILQALRGASFTDVEQIVEFGSLTAYQARRRD